MNILIDIGHPAHVHLFKNFALKMQSKNHNIFFTCRKKEHEVYLLKQYNFQFTSFGKKYNSILGKLFGMLKFDLMEVFEAIKFKPDIFLSHGSIYAAHASFVMRKPHISLEDTFNFEQIRLYKPFTQTILTSDYKHPLTSSKVIKYAGYHELAYLHSNYFYPDKNILQVLNLSENDKYVIMRFVSWNASHDIGHKGISLKNKLYAIKLYEQFAKVFISSESELPDELMKYKLTIPPHKIHDALYYATFLWGESFTMPAECSVIGTPSIINHNTESYYLNEQEKKYGLCFNYSESEKDQINAIEKGHELLQMENLKSQWQKKKMKMLKEKIDVTAFLIWFVENYPSSIITMRTEPNFQYNFK